MEQCKNRFVTGQKAIYLFTQGNFEFYEFGNRFYKIDKQSKKVCAVDRRN